MKINILATGIELTPAISDYADKKVRALEKYIPADNEDVVAQVEVGKVTNRHRTGEIFRAEVHLTGAGLDMYAAVEEEDLYAAIDKVKDEIIKEARRGKGKQMALVRKGEQIMKSAMKGLGNLRKFRFKGFKKNNDETKDIG